MAYTGTLGRTIVLRARRDTVLLVVCATAATFALSSVIHSHAVPQQAAASASVQEQWAGGLAEVQAPAPIVASREPLTSASFVVSSAALALPQVPERALVKLHGCDGTGCAVPIPVRRPAAGGQPPQQASAADTTIVHRATAAAPRRPKPSLISRLNPLKHLPDMTTIKRPFAVAGDSVAGWFKRF